MSTVEVPKNLLELSEKQLKAHYDHAQKLEVDFLVEGNLIDDYSEIEYNAIALQAAKSHWRVPFDSEAFQKYCKTIVRSRIAWVLNQKDAITIYPTDPIMVPSLIDNICKQIGVCTNMKLGIMLVPKMPSLSADELLTKEEIDRISFFLSSMDNYIGARGYVRDKSGVWDFMTMQLIDNQVKNPTMDPHPVYSVFAAVIGVKLLSTVLNPLVTYGDIEVYRSLLWQLTSV